jgi:hypothetical protein
MRVENLAVHFTELSCNNSGTGADWRKVSNSERTALRQTPEPIVRAKEQLGLAVTVVRVVNNHAVSNDEISIGGGYYGNPVCLAVYLRWRNHDS